jgi:hypothetical protein
MNRHNFFAEFERCNVYKVAIDTTGHSVLPNAQFGIIFRS